MKLNANHNPNPNPKGDTKVQYHPFFFSMSNIHDKLKEKESFSSGCVQLLFSVASFIVLFGGLFIS